jgi:hypothetical protein
MNSVIRFNIVVILNDVLLVVVIDHLSQGQWHIDIHFLDGSAVGVDVLNLLVDMFSTSDTSDHRFAFFVSHDLRVQGGGFCAFIFELTVHS